MFFSWLPSLPLIGRSVGFTGLVYLSLRTSAPRHGAVLLCVYKVLSKQRSATDQDGQAILTFQTHRQGHVKTAYRCGEFNACLLLTSRDTSTLNLSSAKPLWPCIKAKAIDTSMHGHKICHTTSLPSCQVWKPDCLNSVRDTDYYYNTSKKYVKFETQLWLWMKVKVTELEKRVHRSLVGLS